MVGVRVTDRNALAKQWGVSPVAIDKLLQQKRLKKVGRGLIDLDHALKFRATQDPSKIQGEMTRKLVRAAEGRSAGSVLAACGICRNAATGSGARRSGKW